MTALLSPSMRGAQLGCLEQFGAVYLEEAGFSLLG